MDKNKEISPEQKARDMLESMGFEGSQELNIGDLFELSNLIEARDSALALISDFKSEVIKVGGYENRFIALHAGGVREYIDAIEHVLKE